MNQRTLTREYIEQLSNIEPHCFETDREEQWFNIGLQYGLEAADTNPKSPWISVDDDLPCNHEELIDTTRHCTVSKDVIVRHKDGSVTFERMIKNYKSQWIFLSDVTHWMPIPELPKK